MSNRHPFNPNLTLYHENEWQGLSVYTARGPLILNYLESIHQVMSSAISQHPRSCIFRFDLHFSASVAGTDSAAISRFFAALKAQLHENDRRKISKGQRIHISQLRYIWVKERSDSSNPHYHVAIFVNRDAYFTLGSFKTFRNSDEPDLPGTYPPPPDERNMVDRIRMAWDSALKKAEGVSGIVHFPYNATYHVDVNGPDFHNQFSALFFRLSYFAKADTKHFGDGHNNFGCSRN